MAICPGPTFDGFDEDVEGKRHLEQKLKVYITSGEEYPNPNRVILVQRYNKNIFIIIIIIIS